MYTVPSNNQLYLQRYSTDFQNLCISSKMLNVGIWFQWKVSVQRRYFTFAMGKVKTFAHRQHLKFCHFQHVHCASKNPISPKVFKRFSKSLHQLQRKILLRVGIWVESFSYTGILDLLQWQGENLYFTFAMATTFEILPLSTCTLCQQKSYISKGIQPIFKIFASARRCILLFDFAHCGHYTGWYVSGERRYFTFAIARWKLCASTTFEILPLSTCTLCQQKSHISKGIQPIFEIFASARRCWGWKFGCKVSGAQVFYFCNGKVKTLRIDNIWNFATFQRCTLCQQKSYISKGIQPIFENLCLSSKMLRVGIWVESFRCAGILLLQWQGENFAHRQHLKFCRF